MRIPASGSGLIAQHFDSRVRHRGDEYVRQRRVRVVDVRERSISAVVTGSLPYRVLISLAARTVKVHCSCPYARDRMDPCKHIWAALVVARKTGFRALDRVRHVYVQWDEAAAREDDVGVHDETDDDLLVDLHEDAPPRDPGPARVSATERSSGGSGTPDPPKPEQWKRVISSAVRREETFEASQQVRAIGEGEILYFVDVQEASKWGELVVEVLGRQRTMSGEWGKPRGFRISPGEVSSLPNVDDRRALTLLNGAREADTWSEHYYSPESERVPRKRRVPFHLGTVLLPVICGTGRCYLRTSSDDTPTLLQWDHDGSWDFWLEVTRADDAPKRSDYMLRGSLRRGIERMALGDPILLTDGGLVFSQERVAPLNDFGAFEWIALLRRSGEIAVPAEDGDDLLTQVLEAPHRPRLDLPAELRYEEVQIAPRPRLLIRAPSSRPRDASWLTAELAFEYDGAVIADGGDGGDLVQRDRRRVLVRDRDAERRAIERLHRLPVRRLRQDYHRGRDPAGYELRNRDLPAVARSLLADGWHVEASGNQFRQPGHLQLKVSSGIDWFELRGVADFGEQSASMPELLAALKRGDHTVALGDGTLGLLPEEWLQKYARLVQMGTLTDDHLRFRKSQTTLLDALLAAQPEATFDAGFAKARRQLESLEGVRPLDAPRSFVGKLRDYQREGLGWMEFLRGFGFGGCLADDMGLGKTVQVLALLDSRRRKSQGRDPKPSLVVAPRSLVFNWKTEATRFTPRLELIDHTGPERATTADGLRGPHVILTTYGTLRRDIDLLMNFEFDYVILDEAQAIKNASTAAAKAARLLKGDHRLALSGTPIENHIGEIWSLFEFLNPGILGTASAFRTVRDGTGDPDADGRELISRVLRPLILRRTKAQVARELPEKVEQSLYCELPSTQRKLYDELRSHYRASLGERIATHGLQKSKILVLEALLRLRQAACHPGLIDRTKSGAPSAKLELLLEQLDEVTDEGHKALVFSQFTSLLSILREHLDRDAVPYAYLDGKTRKRAEAVERFQTDPDCKLFLVSLKAGGLGLNLTAAEYVYLLDPWWNPAVEAQAIDRAHRIGQMRRVFAYRLIAKDTVEEKIVELQQAKRELAESIIKADNALIRDLRREDLELLLS